MFNKKGVPIGEVGFRLSTDGQSIIARSVFPGQGNSTIIEKMGAEWIGDAVNREKLLEIARKGLVSDAVDAAGHAELQGIIRVLEN